MPIVFAYNADSGLFNALTDVAHKIFSPETYACNLCALTHSNFGMRAEWKRFIESLDRPVEFLHADELRAEYGVEGAKLPAVFIKDENGLRELIGAAEINACRARSELEELILERLPPEG